MQVNRILPILALAFLLISISVNHSECKGGGGGSRSSGGYSSSSWGRSSSSSSRGSSSSIRGSSSSSNRGSSSSSSWGPSGRSNYGKSSIWKSKSSGRTKHTNTFSPISYGYGYHASTLHQNSPTWKTSVSKGVSGGGFLLPKTPSSSYIAGLDSRIGGGGWVAPKSYSSARHLSFDNSFGRYGGGKGLFGKSRSMDLFGESGSKSFSFRNGAGFAGRAHPGLASMETLHRYKQYKAMLKYKMYGRCFHGYCGHGIYHRRHCYGGCYGSSFCDFGICRCHNGHYPYHGSCWSGSEVEEQLLEVEQHQSSNMDPFKSCNNTTDCHQIDMNLVCSTKSKKCECREDMKWNEKELECQLYVDVDCSIFEEDFSSLKSYVSDIIEDPSAKSTSTLNLDPKWNECVDDPKEAVKAGFDYRMNSSTSECINPKPLDGHGAYNSITGMRYSCGTDEYKKFCPKGCGECMNKWRAEYVAGVDISDVQLSSYNLTETEDGSLDMNLTSIEPRQTLATSYLTKIDIEKSKPIDVKKEFCLEVKAISTKYSEPERIQPYLDLEEQKQWHENKSLVLTILFFTLVPGACVLCCIISVWKTRKDNERRKKLEPLHRPKYKTSDTTTQSEQNTFMERMKPRGTDNSDNQISHNSESGNCHLPYSLSPPVTDSQSYRPSAPPEYPYSDMPVSYTPPYPVSSTSGYLPYPLSNTQDSSRATDLFSPPDSSSAYHTPTYHDTTTGTNFPSYPPRPQ